MENGRYTLHHGDNREVLKKYPDNHFDSIVCDPPYELGFMGKSWDSTGIAYDVAMWRECWRVLKHGGHLLAFGGSRTYHRMACAIEDAGFEIRDQIMWVYGSGFPKSLNVGRAIDREAGAEREVVGQAKRTGKEAGTYGAMAGDNIITAPATPEAQQWDGWGTALKPAHEPIVVARKPLSEGTVAANVLKWGTGGLNVDRCRVEYESKSDMELAARKSVVTDNRKPSNGNTYLNGKVMANNFDPRKGRFPANFIHDGSEEVVAGFPETTSMGHHPRSATNGGIWANGKTAKLMAEQNNGFGDSGTAARFFYCAKASKEDRDEGCEALEERQAGGMKGRNDGSMGSITMGRNHHATVKPTELMRYLCRLVTPPNGVVLDPFAGSGSTGKGAILEGFYFVGIELEADHVAIAHARLEFALTQWRNAAGEIVVTAAERARGKVSLFDWAADF